MKPILILSFTFLFGISITAQTVLVPSWIKHEVSPNNGKTEGWGIATDQDGNVYWATNTDTLSQGLDIRCHKFAQDGEALWATPFLFGGAGTQQAYVCNSEGNFVYIGGRFCTGLVNTCDMLLLKIDKNNGTLAWDRTLNFSGNGYDEIDGLEITSDGIYCGGWAQELQSGGFESDIGFWKLDDEGNTIWTNYLGQPNTAEHQDGHFVVDGNNIYAAGLWGGDGLANLYNGHAFLGKFSKDDGSVVDSTLFGNQSDAPLDIENALGMTSDGEFLYITGYATPTSPSDWQIFVAKYDKNLNQIWYTDWGGTMAETARGIVVHNDIIYIAGQTESPEISNGGDADAILLQLDTDGNLLEYQIWGDDRKDSFLDIAVNDNHIYLTGIAEADTMGISKEAFLLAVKNESTATHEIFTEKGIGFKIFPNPTLGRLNINLDSHNHDGGLLKVIDAFGNQILTTQIEKNQAELKIEIEATGFFLVHIDFGKYSVSKKVFSFK